MDRRSYLKSGAGVIAGGFIAGCTGSNSGSGSVVPSNVVIGSDIPYKPFEYETPDGELTGFDVDIAQAVFEEQLDVSYEFKPTSFDSIIPSLNNGNFRIIMSAMTINETRDEKVDFSDPYFTAYQTIITRADSSISSRADLEGNVVGVQKGTTGANAAEELQSEFDENIELKKYDQIPAVFSALKNGQVNAVINDNTVNAGFANEEDNIEFVEGEGVAAESDQDAPPYLTLTIENYGIAFRQDDTEFLEEVNEALTTIEDNGTYGEIYSEYFSG